MKIYKKLLILLCVVSLGAAAGALGACNIPVDAGKTSSSDFSSSDGSEDNSSQDSDISGDFDSDSASDSGNSENSSSVHTHEYVGGVCACGEQDPDFTGEAIEYRVDNGVYTGGMKDGVPHGAGVLAYDDGRVLTAEFTEGKYSFGTLVYTDGNVYKGGFDAEGRYSGTGRYTFFGGMYYEGEYVAGLREGEGLFTWSTNGDLDSAWLFKGTFKADKAYYGKTTTTKTTGLLWYEGYMNDLNDIDTSKRGNGYVYFSDTECTYTGELYSSGALDTFLYDGEGHFTWPGSDLVGSWADGAPLRGKKTFYQERENLTPTSYYEGTFKNWNYEGKGRYDYLNGCWYEGDFVNNVFEGDGIFSWNKELGKDVYLVGKFSNGAAVSGTKYWPTRTFGLLEYTGKFSDTDNIDIAVSGTGKYVFPNGDVYEGGMQVTAADGTESNLTGIGKLIFSVPSLSGKELGLDGEASSLKVKEVYGEFTEGEINGSAVYCLTDEDGNAAGYMTGRYSGTLRLGAIDPNFEYTLPDEYEGSKDYTPAEDEA